MVIIVLGGVALAYVRKIRRQKAMREWTARQEASARIIPLPEDQVQTSAPDKKLEQELKAKRCLKKKPQRRPQRRTSRSIRRNPKENFRFPFGKRFFLQAF